jgi:hypothetical protein
MKIVDHDFSTPAARLQKVLRKRVRVARVRMFAQRRLSHVVGKH